MERGHAREACTELPIDPSDEERAWTKPSCRHRPDGGVRGPRICGRHRCWMDVTACRYIMLLSSDFHGPGLHMAGQEALRARRGHVSRLSAPTCGTLQGAGLDRWPERRNYGRSWSRCRQEDRGPQATRDRGHRWPAADTAGPRGIGPGSRWRRSAVPGACREVSSGQPWADCGYAGPELRARLPETGLDRLPEIARRSSIQRGSRSASGSRADVRHAVDLRSRPELRAKYRKHDGAVDACLVPECRKTREEIGHSGQGNPYRSESRIRLSGPVEAFPETVVLQIECRNVPLSRIGIGMP